MILGNTETEVWVKFLQEAQLEAGIRLSENVESYLVFMLGRFTKRTDFGSEALAIKYLEGAQRMLHEKEMRLSDAADECLIMAGLFPERAQRLRVSHTYFAELSEVCFIELSMIAEYFKHPGEAKLYEEMSKSVRKSAQTLYTGRTARKNRSFSES